MIPIAHFTIAIYAGAGVFIFALVILLIRGRKKKTPAEIERERRLALSSHGRVVSGYISDLAEQDGATLILYVYDVAGVTYEVSQDVTMLPTIASAARRLLGHIASVKYDPRNPSNSIIVSEGWSGISGGGLKSWATPQPKSEPGEPTKND